MGLLLLNNLISDWKSWLIFFYYSGVFVVDFYTQCNLDNLLGIVLRIVRILVVGRWVLNRQKYCGFPHISRIEVRDYSMFSSDQNLGI